MTPNRLTIILGTAILVALPRPAVSKPDKTALKANRKNTLPMVTWAPDGKAFYIGSTEKFEKFSAAGKKLGDTKLTKYASGSPSIATYYAGHDAISPDGASIAFRASATGEPGSTSSRIWILDLGSSTISALGDGKGDAYWPAWSSDNATLYYSVKVDKSYTLHSFSRKDSKDDIVCEKEKDAQRLIPLSGGRFLLVSRAGLSVVASSSCEQPKAIGPKIDNVIVGDVNVSPNGKRVTAASIMNGDLWSIDLADGTSTKLGTGAMTGAVWFDDDRVVFSQLGTEGDWHPSDLMFVTSDAAKTGKVLDRTKSCSEGRVAAPPQGGIVAFTHNCKAKPDVWIGVVVALPK